MYVNMHNIDGYTYMCVYIAISRKQTALIKDQNKGQNKANP